MQNVKISNIATTSARLSWNHIENHEGYFISVFPELSGRQNPIQVFNNHFDLSDLEPESDLTMTIYAQLQGKSTDEVKDLKLTTAPVPPKLVIDDITSTSMKVWAKTYFLFISIHLHLTPLKKFFLEIDKRAFTSFPVLMYLVLINIRFYSTLQLNQSLTLK